MSCTSEQLHRIGDWAQRVSAELGSVVRHARPADGERALRAPKAWLNALERCGDAASLRSAVSGLCAAFGRVTSIDIVTVAEPQKLQALCFLRLESEAQESQLMTSLGAVRCGSDVLVIFDLHARLDSDPPCWRSAQAARVAYQ